MLSRCSIESLNDRYRAPRPSKGRTNSTRFWRPSTTNSPPARDRSICSSGGAIKSARPRKTTGRNHRLLERRFTSLRLLLNVVEIPVVEIPVYFLQAFKLRGRFRVGVLQEVFDHALVVAAKVDFEPIVD